MTHEEFLRCTALSREQLVALAMGRLVEDPPGGFIRVPMPPILLLSSIDHVETSGRGGRVVGRQVVRFDDWFFAGHFLGDPVMPGCLILDTAWMVLGLFAGMRGATGRPRAMGCGRLEFFEQVRPDAGEVRYEATVHRAMALPKGAGTLVSGDVDVSVGGTPVARVEQARFGMFENVDRYEGYPLKPSGAPRAGVS